MTPSSVQNRLAETLGYENEVKTKARQANIAAYQSLTGLFKLPTDRQYWTLCNRQSTHDSEINQLASSGFLSKAQFHGVDNNPELIESNRLDHPTANWYVGDWPSIIEGMGNFNPGLIYLDTNWDILGTSTVKKLVDTMFFCGQDTVICANFLLVNPYNRRKADADYLVSALEQHMPAEELEQWNGIQSYQYRARKTDMITYILFKRGTNESVRRWLRKPRSKRHEVFPDEPRGRCQESERTTVAV